MFGGLLRDKQTTICNNMNEIEKQLYPDIEEKLLSIKQIILKNVIDKIVFPDNNDKIVDQRVIAGQIEEQFVNTTIQQIKNSFSPKSVKTTEDVSLIYDWGKLLIDVKTSDENRTFNMTNLISIEKLKKEYFNFYLLYCFINYCSKQKKILSTNLFYVWELPWRYLQIQNLGHGQLQIKNMKNCHNDMDKQNFTTFSREDWYNDLILNGDEFYKNVEEKARIKRIKWIK